MADTLTLPQRSGPKPDTTSSLPHSQINQHGPAEVIDRLAAFCFALSHVSEQDSGISVPGSRALVLHDTVDCNPAAFMIGREFAHIHPHPDLGSMHLHLPPEDAQTVIDAGWGESHYLVTQGRYPMGLVMVFSPRDDAELKVVKTIMTRSYDYAMDAI